jgi:hypothetical protein
VTKSQQTAADLVAALRARNPLIWIRTIEELRVEKYIFEAAAAAGYVPYTWDVAQGVTDIAGKPVPGIGSTDPGETLNAIRDYAKRPAAGRRLWVLRDLSPWLAGPIGITTVRQLRNLTRLLPGTPREAAQAIVVLTPSADVPVELNSVRSSTRTASQLARSAPNCRFGGHMDGRSPSVVSTSWSCVMACH